MLRTHIELHRLMDSGFRVSLTGFLHDVGFDCVSTASSRYDTPRRWRELRLGWKSDSTEAERRLLRLAGSNSGAAEDLIDEPA